MLMLAATCMGKSFTLTGRGSGRRAFGRTDDEESNSTIRKAA